jgi:hypothetical protein
MKPVAGFPAGAVSETGLRCGEELLDFGGSMAGAGQIM